MTDTLTLFADDHPPDIDGGKPGDRDLFARPPVPPTGWRWWLDGAGRRNWLFDWQVAFNASRVYVPCSVWRWWLQWCVYEAVTL